MAIYNIVLLPGYDKRLKLKDQDFLGFSKKTLKKTYKDKNYIVIGEVKKEKQQENTNLLIIGNEKHSVTSLGEHSKLFNRKAGYVCVGGDNYIAILKSRVPFLILLFGLLAGIGIGAALLWNMLTGNDVPVISPNHPLPDVDSNIEDIVGDTDIPNNNISEGGGSVSMIYSLNAMLDLTDSNVDILFKNPAKSNHDVVLELYITKDNERTLIAQSGRIPAGNSLSKMDLMPGSAILSEGVYEGVYKVIYYNPLTGERALVESDITDVEVTVRQ